MQIERITRRVLTALLAIGTVAGIVGRIQARQDPNAAAILVGWPWGVAVLVGLWITWLRVSLHRDDRRGWAIAFSLLAFSSVVVDGTGFSQEIAQVPIIVIMLVWGARWAVTAAAVFVLGVATAAVIMFDQSALGFAGQAFGPLIVALVTLLVSYALAYARDAQRRTQSVLDQLRASSRQVRELSLVQERGRTASELHDGLGHQLTAITLGLQVAARLKERDPDGAWNEVDRTRTLASGALQDLRRWVRALGRFHPGEHRGVDAVRALADSFDTTTLTVEVRECGEARALDDECEVVLYRIVQESLTNVVRHSTGHRVMINVEHASEHVRIRIHDDGIVVDDPVSGYGLDALGDRVREVNGTLSAGPAPDGGFVVTATLPHGTDFTGAGSQSAVLTA